MDVFQWVECCIWDAVVVGSNPVIHTLFLIKIRTLTAKSKYFSPKKLKYVFCYQKLIEVFIMEE